MCQTASEIWKIYDWLLSPYSLWPIDFVGLSKYLLNLVKDSKKLDDDIVLLLSLIGPAPDKETQSTVGAFEHFVEKGNYDHLLKQPEKFKESENAVNRDRELKRIWQQIKKRWEIAKFQNSRGVIRRRMSQERNFRENWDFDWSDQKRKFNVFFDAMCYRWKLYGMEYDKPLLLKISANPTPHGTMIVIPRHWSLDLSRDLHWNKIGKLHRAHKPLRQGPKLSLSRIEKQKESKQVLKFWDEAGAKKLTGNARYDYVHTKMKKDRRTDHSWVNRNLRLARDQ